MAMTASPHDWDHLRIFVAMMRSKSLREAAERLNMSHPTVRRHLDALEADLALKLFDRRPDGLHATAAAAALLPKAEAVESAIHALGRSALDASPTLSGRVHVTAPDILLSELLAPDLVAFVRTWPEITLDVDTDYALADLGSREADIALRFLPLDQLPDDSLVGIRAATMYAAIYGHTEEQWLGWGDDRARPEFVTQSRYSDLPSIATIRDAYLQRTACVEGLGLSVLPCFMAPDGLPQLTPAHEVAAIWVLVHPDLRRNPRLRVFREAMVAALKRLGPRLEGREAT